MAKTAKKPKTAKPKATAPVNGDGALSDGGGDGEAKGKWAPGTGKQLVIVESPAKAKTINKYLGRDYLVMASVGHVRDLPSRNPKGQKSPVPGVDLEHNFEPTYEIMAAKKKTVTDLKKAAKGRRTSGSRPTWTARARRSRGTWPRRCGSIHRPRSAWCSTRSRRRKSRTRSTSRARSTSTA
jgi:hypothetical protein